MQGDGLRGEAVVTTECDLGGKGGAGGTVEVV